MRKIYYTFLFLFIACSFSTETWSQCVSANGGTITPSTYSICNGQTTVLTSTGATVGIGISYQWKVSAVSGGPYVNVSGGTGATTVSYTTGALTTGTYYYVLQTTCSTGPVTALSNEATVTVNPNPTAGIIVNTVCLGSPINLIGLTDIGTGFNWTGPNGFSSTSQYPFVPSSTLLNAGDYVFTASDAGCSSQATVTVTVGQHPAGVVASVNDAVICTGDTIDLNSSVTTAVNVLSENFDLNAPSWTITNAPTSPAVANWAPVTCPFSQISGSLAFTNFSTTNGGKFFMCNSDAGGSGTTTNTILTSPVFSTVGMTSAQLSFEHLYQRWASGDLTVAVQISTNNGGSWTNLQTYSSDQGIVTANAEVTTTANINLSAYLNQPTLKIRFNYVAVWGYYWIVDNVQVNGNQTHTYNWTSSPAGFSSTAQNITDVIPAGTTTYNVNITNGQGCSSSDTALVTVNTLPVVGYSLTGNDTVCSGDPVTLSGTGATFYNWTGGITDATQFNPTSTNTYMVTGTTNGCSDTAIATITVNALPAVNSNILPNDTVCAGGFITFNGTGANTYAWTGGISNGVATPSIAGNYTVTGTDANGCTNTSTATIVVNLLPAVGYTAISNDTVCMGDSVTLSGTGGVSYNWTGGIVDGVSFIPTVSDTYTVTATNANGCTNSVSASVTVIPTPPVSFSILPNDTVCPGNQVTFTPLTPDIYTWSDGVTSGTPFTPASSHTYSVVITTIFGCTTTSTADVVVGTLPTVNLGADVVQPNPPAVLNAGSGFTSYLWSTTETTSTISVNTNGVYIVTVANIFGCTDTDTIQVNFTSGVMNMNGSATEISLYPNPTAGPFGLSIQNLETSNLVIDVMDMTGRIVYNRYIGSVNGNITESFDLTGLGAGVYILRANANGKSTQLRFIISE